jgi:hypothetical protein
MWRKIEVRGEETIGPFAQLDLTRSGSQLDPVGLQRDLDLIASLQPERGA